MANFTLAGGNYTSEINQTSTESWPVGVLVFLPALNIFLSITASLGNALILNSLHKESTLHPSTKLLFRCLAVTDLCVGFISQPLYVTFIFAIFDIRKITWDFLFYIGEGIHVTSIILCGMSILTSTAISVDRLLALLLGLRYRHVATLRRTRAVIVCFSVISFSCGAVYFWSHSISWIVIYIFGVLCLIISILSYTKIYVTLRQHQAQVQDHVHRGQPNGGGIPLNIARYKKSVSSIAWVQFVLVVCYVPFLVVTILINTTETGLTLYMVWLVTITLVYLNSSLNPILYCWKIKGVRQAAKDTIKQLCCCLCS
ncbi:melanocortin receptor 5-like [Oculina patagonica]